MKKLDIAVVFDMDGVIFDSERAYIDMFRRICDEEGLPFIEESCIECIGANRDRTRQIYKKWYGEDFDFDHYYGLVRERILNEPFRIKPGVKEMFGFVKDSGMPTALASSTTRASVLKMLGDAGLLEYFDAVICGDMVSHSKPHPEIFLTAARHLGVEPGRCFVIEDSYNGIRCAHNAGMRPIMVPDILQPDDEIRDMAEAVLPDLFAAAKYLREELDIQR